MKRSVRLSEEGWIYLVTMLHRLAEVMRVDIALCRNDLTKRAHRGGDGAWYVIGNKWRWMDEWYRERERVLRLICNLERQLMPHRERKDERGSG